MKNILSIIGLFLLSTAMYSQSTNQNYVRTRTYVQEKKNAYLDQVQYFDGLGRPSQTIQVGVTPSETSANRKDLVSIQEYDSFGRETNSWLPAAISANKGSYVDLKKIKDAAVGASMYNDQTPFSKPVYENSPLCRVVEHYGPGANWHNKEKSIKTFYLTNKGSGLPEKTITMGEEESKKGVLSGVYTSCDAIILKTGFQFKASDEKNLILRTDPNLCQAPKVMSRATALPSIRDEFLMCINYKVEGGKLVKNSNYKAGELYVTLMMDEDDNKSLEFKDKLGQVILTRQINGGEKYDTYYVYDDFGNLSYVLPPRAVDEITNYADGDVKMKQLAYLYKYDKFNRCTEKRLPGIEPIYYVYDKADRVIFSQDGVQRDKGEWAFSIPDVFGRVVLTGICKNTLKVGTEIGAIVKATGNGGATNLTMGYTVIGVTLASGFSVLSANYYDGYSFLGFNDIPSNANRPSAKGMLTGVLTTQLNGTAAKLYSVMYYDTRGRLIETKSNNHLGGTESEHVTYNFVGQPLTKKHIHTVSGVSTTELYTYTYDHAGRLKDTKHQLNNGITTLIASNTYDDLGRLKSNKKGNHDNLNTLYAYNIRSWTNSMKSNVLHVNLDYTHSGNIKSQSWIQEGKTRKYDFTYDGLSRLTAAAFTGIGTEKYGTSYTYDKHGNMMSIKRDGKTSSSHAQVDNLTMTYNGNQLTKVRDAVKTPSIEGSADFINHGGDNALMKYNTNGALVADSHKGITSIQYNSLNLPTSMAIGNTMVRGDIQYTYSAGGQKLRTVHKEDIAMVRTPIVGTGVYATPKWETTTTDYVGNKIYEKVDNSASKLKRILIDGGYIEDGKYHYYLTDHLGNNRAVAEASGIVIQRTHYYPFGMAFAESTAGKKQPYKYNGKELDTRLQLNSYDYSARYMDPAIGRFTSIDPLAEKYYSISPDAYVMNNPLKWIDPDGKQVGFPFNPGQMRASYTDQQVQKSYSTSNYSGAAVKAARETIGYTDVNDALVLATTITGATGITDYGGTNADGTSATTLDKVGAGLGAFLPLVSGSAVIKGFKKLFGVGESTAKSGLKLSREELKSISSLEKQIDTHKTKLKEYKQDPMKFDNKDMLKNAPSEEIREKMISGRVKHLEHEIDVFKDNIEKIKKGE